MTPVLEGRSLTRRYALGEMPVDALAGVDVQVMPGEFVAVTGPSGSGKSTLLNLLGLIDLPDAGEVLVGGVSTRGLSDDALTRLRRERLGFVFQTFELLPSLTARENILLPADVAGRRAAGEARLSDLAAKLGIAERLKHRPSQLSGGQRQRVAIARALINAPLVILADEPTGNLDRETGRAVLGLLEHRVRQDGLSVLMVTHDPEAARRADRTITLLDGRIG